jgi:hypothetical protein
MYRNLHMPDSMMDSFPDVDVLDVPEPALANPWAQEDTSE